MPCIRPKVKHLRSAQFTLLTTPTTIYLYLKKIYKKKRLGAFVLSVLPVIYFPSPV